MTDRIAELALLSVARGCGFAALGILVLFIGLSTDLVLALKSAGYLTLLACSVLLLNATLAFRQPYRRTELWVMLKPDERPSADVAQSMISAALRDAYLEFARHAAALTIMFLMSSIFLAAFQK